MIFCSIPLHINSFDAAKYSFERSAIMYDLRDSGSFAMDHVAMSGKQKKATSAVLSWQAPDRVSGSFTDSEGTAEFFVDRFKTIKFRRDLNQYVTETKDDKITVRQAAMFTEPKFEGIALAFMEVGEVAKYYEVFAKLPNWKTQVKDGQVRLNSQVNGTDYLFVFSAKDFSLVHHRLTKDAVTQDWRFRPGPGVKSFMPPARAYQVVAFEKPLPEPKYADRTAKAIVAKMFYAYDRPAWLAFEIRDRSETTTVYLKGQKMRQIDESADFTYDGTTASVWSKKSNTMFEGKAKSSAMFAAVADAGTRVDPMVAQLIQGINPFRVLLSRDATVKVSMKLKDRSGAAVTLLEATTKVDTLNIAVRDSDGKVLSIMTGLKGNGETISTQRVFEYLPKSAVDDATSFRVTPPSSTKRRPMSDVETRTTARN